MASQSKKSQLTTADEGCVAFVKKVKRIPGVLLVVADRQGDQANIWTLISEVPFGKDVCFKVYEAQGDVAQALGQPLLDFRLINIQELPAGRPLKEYFPLDWEVLYRGKEFA